MGYFLHQVLQILQMSRKGQIRIRQAWQRLAQRKSVRQFCGDDGGAVAIIVAVCGLILLVLAGAAIDMALYVERRSQITAAVDAALLAAVSTANSAEAAGRGLTEAASAGSAAAGKVYADDIAGIGADVTGSDLSITVEKKTVSNVRKWVASATVDGSYITYFMKIVGTDSLPIKVAAASVGAINQSLDYWEFSIAVDTSQSMGIGTTVADMNTMIAYDNCYFACHEGPNDRMSILRAKGVDFRIDAVSRAVSAMAATIKSTMTGNVKVALYNFDSTVYVPIRMTSKIDDLVNYTIELPVWTPTPRAKQLKTSDGVTVLNTMMTILNAFVPAPGDGSSADKPKRAVFLITDGVQDTLYRDATTVYTSDDGLHNTGPLDTTSCTALKKKGVMVSVLYITYYIPTNVRIPEVEPFKDQILTKLKACASSPSLFFNATNPDDIKLALQGMLKAVQENVRVRLTD